MNTSEKADMITEKKADGKTILLGVTGCIAAYKACELLRGLQREGVRVKVVMTSHAMEFVGPATFRALTGEPVAIDLFDGPGEPIHHISLAQEVDVFIIAPCTANVLNKLANGIADDLLTTTALATQARLIIAPAMNVNMWNAEETQSSVARLKARGILIIEPESGYLACGEEGKGRLADVDVLITAALKELKRMRDLEGKHILITAGPTREPLDPVRYISSPSSGLTGFLLAQEAVRRGADVTLVTGPVELLDPRGANTIRVTTAREMYEAASRAFVGVDAAIFTAAVADFRPATCASGKIKKGRDVPDRGSFSLELVPNPDILASLAAEKRQSIYGRPVYIVGFAAETDDLEASGRAKLKSKNADLIVANNITLPGLGFGSTRNQVLLIDEYETKASGVISKQELATIILDRVASAL